MSAGTNIGTTPIHHDIPIKEETEEDVTALPAPATSSIKRESFRCGECGEYFYYEKYFLEHIQEHHKTPARVEAVRGTDKLTAGQETGGVECKNSRDATTGTLAASASHSPSRRRLEIPAGGGSGKKTYRCDVCNYTAKSKYHLTRHSRFHTGVLPVACTQCDYSCVWKSQLKLHMSMKHTGEKPYKCNVCSYAAAAKGDLTKHSRLHTGKLPYSCSSCDYKCNHPTRLKQHAMSNHTGEKPYKCNVCSYATVVKGHLTTHSRLHTGKLPYSCSSCNYKCNMKTQLNIHTIMKHTGEKPYKCTACSYATASKSSLTVHSRLHTVKLLYSCSSCDYKCIEKKHLKIHTTSKHVRELKPYKCNVCNYTTDVEENLAAHWIIHTDTQPKQVKYYDLCGKCGKMFVVCTNVTAKSNPELSTADTNSLLCSNCKK